VSLSLKWLLKKLKIHKSPAVVQILAEFIKARGGKIRSEVHKLINSIWNKEEFPEEWKERSLYPFIRKVIKTIVVITEA
jgi:hypothetical protein